MADKRDEFLFKMYDQVFNDINRHIFVNWQSSGVLVGAFAIFSLIEKQVITIDLATTLMILICGWLLAHLFDASYWYNRNLCIIANIERQFLKQSDLKDIHYYFGAHRPKNRMIFHLQIQFALGIGIGFFVLLYHFLYEIAPNFSWNFSDFSLIKSLPYLVLICVVLYLIWVNKIKDKSYEEFLSNSPGIQIDSDEIDFGVGHGFDKTKVSKTELELKDTESIKETLDKKGPNQELT